MRQISLFFILILLVLSQLVSISAHSATVTRMQESLLVSQNQERFIYQRCIEDECEYIGRKQGYTKQEIKLIKQKAETSLKTLKISRYGINIGLLVVGGWAFQAGKTLVITAVALAPMAIQKSGLIDESAEDQYQVFINSSQSVMAEGEYSLLGQDFDKIINALELAILAYESSVFPERCDATPGCRRAITEGISPYKHMSDNQLMAYSTRLILMSGSNPHGFMGSGVSSERIRLSAQEKVDILNALR